MTPNELITWAETIAYLLLVIGVPVVLFILLIYIVWRDWQ
jgi:hypothetical protein